MKRKLKVSLMLITLMLMMPIFTGCPSDERVEFKNYSITKLNDYNSVSSFSVDLGIEKSYKGYYFNVTGPVDSIQIGQGNSKLGTILGNGKSGLCLKVEEGELDSKYSYASDFDLDKYYSFAIFSKISVNDKRKIGVNNYFNYKVNIYKDSGCNKLYKSYKTKDFKLSDETPDFNKKVISAIGGNEHYCNVDSNGNYNFLNSDNLFVNIAYSQVTYRIKRENKNLNDCYFDGSGKDVSKKYSKYGIGSTVEETSLNFVKWVAKKSGTNFPFEIYSYEKLIDWAKDNKRYYTNCAYAKEGDLVLHSWEPNDSQTSIGILYKMKNGLGMIAPTPMIGIYGAAAYDIWSDAIATGEPYCSNNSSKEGNFISMSGITYKPSNSGTSVPTYLSVRFDSAGGSNVEKQAVKYNETVPKPNNPTKEGYKFVEWQLDGKTYDFSQPVTKDITLKAVWRKLKTYQVIINTNSEAGATIMTVTEGNKVPKPNLNLTKEGYQFLEWQQNGKAYDFNKIVTGNITLDAKWIQKSYTVLVEFVDTSANSNRRLIIREGTTIVKDAQAIRTINGVLIAKEAPFTISAYEVSDLGTQVIVVLRGGTKVKANVVIRNN